jgi:crotonobetainyl-CoA:carnitine CoA-transferase CaiB-like acyl-CoA transferase
MRGTDQPAETPLAGVTVLDCTVTIPGPYATSLLQRMGARIIKLEPPGGDATRRPAPRLHAALNRGKESVVVDLRRPDDLEFALALAARSDVFVEGWRPGVATKLGLGPDAVRERNAAVVYCSISGYGSAGPLQRRAGHDLNYLALSGATRVMSGTGDPVQVRLPLADLAGGTMAALRIAAAVVGARANGRGTFIDASLAGAVRDWVESVGGAEDEDPLGSVFALSHYGTYETADGHHLTVGVVGEDHLWREICDALGLVDRRELTTSQRARTPELASEIATVVAQRTRTELESVLSGCDSCWAFVESPLGESPIGGMVPPSVGEVPELGQHTESVKEELRTSDRPPRSI